MPSPFHAGGHYEVFEPVDSLHDNIVEGRGVLLIILCMGVCGESVFVVAVKLFGVIFDLRFVVVAGWVGVSIVGADQLQGKRFSVEVKYMSCVG